MPVPLYMDVHVPQAITDQLRRRGVDVLTAIEDKSATASTLPSKKSAYSVSSFSIISPLLTLKLSIFLLPQLTANSVCWRTLGG